MMIPLVNEVRWCGEIAEVLVVNGNEREDSVQVGLNVSVERSHGFAENYIYTTHVWMDMSQIKECFCSPGGGV